MLIQKFNMQSINVPGSLMLLAIPMQLLSRDLHTIFKVSSTSKKVFVCAFHLPCTFPSPEEYFS